MDGEWLLHRGCISGRVHRTCMPACCTGRLACVGCDAWGDRVGAAVCGQSGRGVAQDDCIVAARGGLWSCGGCFDVDGEWVSDGGRIRPSCDP